MNTHYDLIVIGCGPGGYKSAIIAAQAGYSVAIIEKSQAGGTCLNQGCIPKEALTRIAKLIDDIKAFEGIGLQLTAQKALDSDDNDINLSHVFSHAIEHKNSLTNKIGKTVEPWLKQLGIQFFYGDASFENKNTINITATTKEETQNKTIKGDRIIIATGSKPSEHPSIPFRSPDIICSQTFMFDVNTLPQRVLFIGGGCVSSELAFVLNKFGSQVTIVEHSDRLLNHPNIPERASSALEQAFKKLDIKVKKSTRAITEIATDKSINVLFSDSTADGFDLVFIAVGRTADTENLKLENADIKTDDSGFIITNDFLETSSTCIYAIGDTKRCPASTNMTANVSFHDAKIATVNALRGNNKKCDYDSVPFVIDSAVQIACVGHTEESAENAGYDVEVIRSSIGGSTIGQLSFNAHGFVDIVYDENSNKVLGGCIVGPQAREMIQTLSAAMNSERGLKYFTELNYAHPSWNEEFENIVSRHIFILEKIDDTKNKNKLKTELTSE